jgi:hypothetical protein
MCYTGVKLKEGGVIMIVPLGQEVSILVTGDDDRPAYTRKRRLRDKVVERFTDEFGGATIQNVSGTYRMENGEIATDHSYKIIGYAENLVEAEHLIMGLAKGLQEGLDQESILYTIEGHAYLYYGENKR